MRVRVLGSAAGGGFPQWNCRCPNCCAVREHSPSCRPRTQSSLAVSPDGQHWWLFNASPDLHRQVESFPALWPRGEIRQSPLEGVVLTDAELDHTLGLLLLREGRRLRLVATAWVYQALQEQNPLLRTLSAYATVEWQPARLETPFALETWEQQEVGLRCEAFSTGSHKLPPFADQAPSHPEASVGYRLTDISTGHTLVYLPAVQEFTREIRQHLEGCACLLVDGTCWEDEELIRLGISSRTARAMGHLPIAGPGGSLEYLATLNLPRTIYLHLNNTNPLLLDDSVPRRIVEEHDLEVAIDGLELEL